MKMKNGFVSNSSSSSFVAFAPREKYRAAFAMLMTEDADLLNQISIESVMCLEEEFFKMTCYTSDGDIYINNTHINDLIGGGYEEEDYDHAQEFKTAFHRLVSILKTSNALLWDEEDG